MKVNEFGSFEYGNGEFVYPWYKFVDFKELKNGDIWLIDDAKNEWVFKNIYDPKKCTLKRKRKRNSK